MFNRNLILSIALVGIVVTVRLADIAITHNNWPGFWFSLLHVVVVGIGSYYALRRRPTKSTP